MRDFDGKIVDLFCKPCMASSAFHGEAQALYDATFKMKDRDLGQVAFESDCLSLVKAVKNHSQCPDLRAEILVMDLRLLFQNHQLFSLNFVSRTCNLAAD